MSQQRLSAETRPGLAAAFAWLVHMFTASGAVLALLALMAVIEERWHLALAWLFAALVVDGVDGSFARWARTKELASRINGDTLDLVIDYLTYVFVPTIFLWRTGLIPVALAPWLAAAIQIASLYVFARSDMKTSDNYFRGFPALWNLVAFYLFVLQPSPATSAIVVGCLVLLTFAPVHFVHPFRVSDYGRWLPLLATLWAASTFALLWDGWSEAARPAIVSVSVGSATLLLALGLLRSARGKRPQAASTGRD